MTKLKTEKTLKSEYNNQPKFSTQHVKELKNNMISAFGDTLLKI